jgi:hypothetical protein
LAGNYCKTDIEGAEDVDKDYIVRTGYAELEDRDYIVEVGDCNIVVYSS